MSQARTVPEDIIDTGRQDVAGTPRNIPDPAADDTSAGTRPRRSASVDHTAASASKRARREGTEVAETRHPQRVDTSSGDITIDAVVAGRAEEVGVTAGASGETCVGADEANVVSPLSSGDMPAIHTDK